MTFPYPVPITRKKESKTNNEANERRRTDITFLAYQTFRGMYYNMIFHILVCESILSRSRAGLLCPGISTFNSTSHLHVVCWPVAENCINPSGLGAVR